MGPVGVLLAGVGWVLVAAVVVLPFVHSFTRLSYIDEYQHVDYLAKTQKLEHVNGGERVGQVAMREQACRGMDLPGVVLPKCGKRHYDPVEFPGAGFNHTYADPPTYYLVTAPLTSVVQKVTGVDSMVTAARSVGVLWLGAGLAATWALALRLGASRRAAVGATLLIATTPAVMLSAGTVTTDAPQLLAGGIMCLVALAVVEGRRAWWWLAPTAFAASAIKVTSLAVVGVVAVLLVATWWARRRGTDVADGDAVAAEDADRGRRGTVRSAPRVARAARDAGRGPGPARRVERLLLRHRVRERRRHPGGAAVQGHAPDLGGPQRQRPQDDLARTPPLRARLRHERHRDPGAGAHQRPADHRLRRGRLVRLAATGGARLALGTAVAMALGAPAYLLMLYVTEHVSYWIPGRYGLSILPAAAALLAVAASRRNVGSTALLVLGGLSAVALLAQTI